ncbi:homeobox domain protein [Oesophagostomum dentatum]|uniref:Homeobox domain protein n=1 Tax=Oesophagostomum dentatum TaxID=61180 RepID=A0A0B1T402_OESDE|nr:homeobox domain protein [Oesophagostomum dentatum]
MENSSCAYPDTGIFDEISWMPMPPAYYAYPVPGAGQPGYAMPMPMAHSMPYPMASWYNYATSGTQAGGKYKKKRNLFTKLQLNMLHRRFAEKEHIRQPERDSFAQMIGLTGEQAAYYQPPSFPAQEFQPAQEEKLSLSTCSEDDQNL